MYYHIKEKKERVKKYCKNCGAQISENARFCEKCGVQIAEEQKGNSYVVGNQPDKKRKIAFYISIFTSPVIFIIRMLTQQEQFVRAGVGGAWMDHTKYYVPANIKAIMFVLLAVSYFLIITLRKDSNDTEKKYSRITNILMIANAFLSYYIIYAS